MAINRKNKNRYKKRSRIDNYSYKMSLYRKESSVLEGAFM